MESSFRQSTKTFDHFVKNNNNNRQQTTILPQQQQQQQSKQRKFLFNHLNYGSNSKRLSSPLSTISSTRNGNNNESNVNNNDENDNNNEYNLNNSTRKSYFNTFNDRKYSRNKFQPSNNDNNQRLYNNYVVNSMKINNNNNPRYTTTNNNQNNNKRHSSPFTRVGVGSSGGGGGYSSSSAASASPSAASSSSPLHNNNNNNLQANDISSSIISSKYKHSNRQFNNFHNDNPNDEDGNSYSNENKLLDWLEYELDKRGIDSLIYGRYLLSLLQQTTNNDWNSTYSLNDDNLGDCNGDNETFDSGYEGSITSNTNRKFLTKSIAKQPRYCELHQKLYRGHDGEILMRRLRQTSPSNTTTNQQQQQRSSANSFNLFNNNSNNRTQTSSSSASSSSSSSSTALSTFNAPKISPKWMHKRYRQSSSSSPPFKSKCFNSNNHIEQCDNHCNDYDDDYGDLILTNCPDCCRKYSGKKYWGKDYRKFMIFKCLKSAAGINNDDDDDRRNQNDFDDDFDDFIDELCKKYDSTTTFQKPNHRYSTQSKYDNTDRRNHNNNNKQQQQIENKSESILDQAKKYYDAFPALGDKAIDDKNSKIESPSLSSGGASRSHSTSSSSCQFNIRNNTSNKQQNKLSSQQSSIDDSVFYDNQQQQQQSTNNGNIDQSQSMMTDNNNDNDEPDQNWNGKKIIRNIVEKNNSKLEIITIDDYNRLQRHHQQDESTLTNNTNNNNNQSKKFIIKLKSKLLGDDHGSNYKRNTGIIIKTSLINDDNFDNISNDSNNDNSRMVTLKKFPAMTTTNNSNNKDDTDANRINNQSMIENNGNNNSNQNNQNQSSSSKLSAKEMAKINQLMPSFLLASNHQHSNVDDGDNNCDQSDQSDTKMIMKIDDNHSKNRGTNDQKPQSVPEPAKSSVNRQQIAPQKAFSKQFKQPQPQQRKTSYRSSSYNNSNDINGGRKKLHSSSPMKLSTTDYTTGDMISKDNDEQSQQQPAPSPVQQPSKMNNNLNSVDSLLPDFLKRSAQKSNDQKSAVSNDELSAAITDSKGSQNLSKISVSNDDMKNQSTINDKHGGIPDELLSNDESIKNDDNQMVDNSSGVGGGGKYNDLDSVVINAINDTVNDNTTTTTLSTTNDRVDNDNDLLINMMMTSATWKPKFSNNNDYDDNNISNVFGCCQILPKTNKIFDEINQVEDSIKLYELIDNWYDSQVQMTNKNNNDKDFKNYFESFNDQQSWRPLDIEAFIRPSNNDQQDDHSKLNQIQSYKKRLSYLTEMWNNNCTNGYIFAESNSSNMINDNRRLNEELLLIREKQCQNSRNVMTNPTNLIENVEIEMSIVNDDNFLANLIDLQMKLNIENFASDELTKTMSPKHEPLSNEINHNSNETLIDMSEIINNVLELINHEKQSEISVQTSSSIINENLHSTDSLSSLSSSTTTSTSNTDMTSDNSSLDNELMEKLSALPRASSDRIVEISNDLKPSQQGPFSKRYKLKQSTDLAYDDNYINGHIVTSTMNLTDYYHHHHQYQLLRKSITYHHHQQWYHPIDLSHDNNHSNEIEPNVDDDTNHISYYHDSNYNEDDLNMMEHLFTNDEQQHYFESYGNDLYNYDGYLFKMPSDNNNHSKTNDDQNNDNLDSEQLYANCKFNIDVCNYTNLTDGSKSYDLENLQPIDVKFKLENRYLVPDNETKPVLKPCAFFLENSCARLDCKFSHDLSSIPCKYYLEGACYKDEFCPFLHEKPKSDLEQLMNQFSSPSQYDSRANDINEFKIESDSDFPSLFDNNNNDDDNRQNTLNNHTINESLTNNNVNHDDDEQQQRVNFIYKLTTNIHKPVTTPTSNNVNDNNNHQRKSPLKLIDFINLNNDNNNSNEFPMLLTSSTASQQNSFATKCFNVNNNTNSKLMDNKNTNEKLSKSNRSKIVEQVEEEEWPSLSSESKPMMSSSPTPPLAAPKNNELSSFKSNTSNKIITLRDTNRLNGLNFRDKVLMKSSSSSSTLSTSMKKKKNKCGNSNGNLSLKNIMNNF